MKIKKFLTSLLVASFAICSLSALDIELGINQGFPIEYIVTKNADDSTVTKSLNYDPDNDRGLFATSTGADATVFFTKMFGVDASFDFGYTNKPNYLSDTVIKDASITESATSLYFKIAPAIRLGSKKFAFILTPGFVFGNYSRTITTTGRIPIIGKEISESSTTKQACPFGLGIGAKLSFAVTNHVKINAGLDFDYMLKTSKMTQIISGDENEIQSNPMENTDQNQYMNIMPKIGVSYAF